MIFEVTIFSFEKRNRVAAVVSPKRMHFGPKEFAKGYLYRGFLWFCKCHIFGFRTKGFFAAEKRCNRGLVFRLRNS